MIAAAMPVCLVMAEDIYPSSFSFLGEGANPAVSLICARRAVQLQGRQFLGAVLCEPHAFSWRQADGRWHRRRWHCAGAPASKDSSCRVCDRVTCLLQDLTLRRGS